MGIATMNELNLLRVPRVLNGIDPLVIDMTAIRYAESRLSEVAIVNSARAAELLSLFNNAWLVSSKYLDMLKYESDCAERKASEVRAIFIVDKLPDLLKAKGLSTPRSPLGSEDIRLAFLEIDVEYKKIRDLQGILKSYVHFFETYRKAFENSYNSVKKLITNDQFAWRPNPGLVVHTTENPSPQLEVGDNPNDYSKITSTAEESPEEQSESFDGFFGKPETQDNRNR